MKKDIRYPSFSRIERMGFIVLSVLLLLIVITWQTLPYWYPRPPANKHADEQLELAYQQFRAAHLTLDETETAIAQIPAQLFPFDPNTLDSPGFRRLGLSARVVKGLMNWRRHGKIFYKKEDLKALYNLSAEEYIRLAPYITVAARQHTFGNTYANYKHLPPLPAIIDLNTSDSATLVRLNGIGPTLAHKIVLRRTALGGYFRHEQLLEVYKFSDTTFAMLKAHLSINAETVKKLKLNTATQEELQLHPYIGEKIAKNILLLRKGMKRFEHVQQLRQVPLMNEEIYRKIAPYFIID